MSDASKSQMTSTAWVATMIAVISIITSIGLGLRSEYFRQQASVAEKNHEEIIHINDEIAQINGQLNAVLSLRVSQDGRMKQ